jgi:GTPase involved in cell partitioning and DNA repair
MKNLFLFTCTLLTLFSCTTDTSNLESENETFSKSLTNKDTLLANKRNCASQEILEYELKRNPELALKIEEIEEFSKKAIQSDIFEIAYIQIEIPVVINVLYRTSEENISLSQIQREHLLITCFETASYFFSSTVRGDSYLFLLIMFLC